MIGAQSAITSTLASMVSNVIQHLRPQHLPDLNELSTTGVALPGALGLKLAKSHPNMLAMVGDGAFLMNSQEIETAVRERIAGRADLQHPAGTPTDLAAGPHSRGTVATTA